MQMKKAYYYRVQVSYPRTNIMYFKSYGKREIKQWTKDNHVGPDEVFIDDPVPDEPNASYVDLTVKHN